MSSVEQRAHDLLAAEYAKACANGEKYPEADEIAIRAIAAALREQPEALVKHQPCGCVICTCEDEVQCQGCGAKHCGNRTDHPPYVKQQPETRGVVDVTDEMVERARSAYSVDRVSDGEILDAIAGREFANRLIRGILTAAQRPVQEGGGNAPDSVEFWAERLEMLADVHGCGSATMRESARLLRKLATAPPSAPVGVEALVAKWDRKATEHNRGMQSVDAALSVLAAEAVADLRSLTQQPAQAAPGDDARDAARWRYTNQPGFFRTTGYNQYGESMGEISVGVQKSRRDYINASITGRGKTFVEAVDAAIAATPPGDDAAGGGHD